MGVLLVINLIYKLQVTKPVKQEITRCVFNSISEDKIERFKYCLKINMSKKEDCGISRSFIYSGK